MNLINRPVWYRWMLFWNILHLSVSDLPSIELFAVVPWCSAQRKMSNTENWLMSMMQKKQRHLWLFSSECVDAFTFDNTLLTHYPIIFMLSDQTRDCNLQVNHLTLCQVSLTLTLITIVPALMPKSPSAKRIIACCKIGMKGFIGDSRETWQWCWGLNFLHMIQLWLFKTIVSRFRDWNMTV